MPPATDALYWIALNLLPTPLASVRTLHAALGGSADALAALTPGRLAALLGPGARGPARPRRRADDGRAGQSAPAPDGVGGGRAGDSQAESDAARSDRGATNAAWWEKVHAGGIGYASPLAARFCEGRIGGDALLEEALQESRRAKEQGVSLITLDDPRYPPLLASCSAPPPVLSFRGRFQPENDSPAATGPCGWWAGAEAPGIPAMPHPPVPLAVVGSREPTLYGRDAARRLGRAIGLRGGLLVSGLARGLDGEAHAGALESGGETLAVLAGGLGGQPVPFPNRALARRIERQGALVSEYPLLTPVHTDHFPRRNRIISGLSVATVVVEAAHRSGSLITARLALEEGRDVFAVPGRWNDPTAEGANGLLRNGAGVLCRAEDLFDDLPGPWRDALREPAEEDRPEGLPPVLTAVEKEVFQRLRTDEASGVDELVGSVEGPPARVLAALVSLEIRDLVVASPGGTYRRRS